MANKKQKVETAQANSADMEALQKVEDRLGDLDDELERQKDELNKQFVVKREPLLKERDGIAARIPGFWCTTFENGCDLELTTLDSQIMHHCTTVSVTEKKQDSPGEHFRITLTFSANDWFTNTELWKEINATDDTIEIQQSGIEWKDGKKPKPEPVAQVGEKRDAEDEHCVFFTFFEKTEQEMDPMVADSIHGKLYPDAVRYYVGDVSDDEFDDEEDSELEDA